jgi:hypothetical protein
VVAGCPGVDDEFGAAGGLPGVAEDELSAAAAAGLAGAGAAGAGASADGDASGAAAGGASGAGPSGADVDRPPWLDGVLAASLPGSTGRVPSIMIASLPDTSPLRRACQISRR